VAARPSHVGIGLLRAAAIAALLLALAACPKQLVKLDQAKELQQSGNFEALAALDFQCSAKDEGCNQLHLLKGDACFRLAARSTDSTARKARLDCATSELSAGIDMTTDWDQGGIDRARFYENLCESARLRADLGDSARFEDLLATRARQFVGFAPGNPGAVYYESRAEFYTFTRAGVRCDDLRSLHARLADATNRFAADPRYRDAFPALRGTVSSELQRSCPR